MGSNQRVTFSKHKPLIKLPNLLENQHQSFQWFLDEGLKELFEEVDSIDDYTGSKLSLRFKDYRFEDPKVSEVEAKENNITYDAPLYAMAELTNKVTGEVSEQEIYLGDYPMMTERATFTINGSDRVVVSQLIRSPGVIFTADNINDRNYYGAKLNPARGAWLEFETTTNDEIFVRIDRKRKLPATTLLRALGLSTNKQIQEAFAHVEVGEVDHIQNTIAKDPAKNTSDALIEVYKRLRPGDMATVENAKNLIDSTFFNFKRFDLSKVGRYKMNRRLNIDVPNTNENRVMRLDDVIAVMAEVIRLNNTQDPEDEMDSFANRRLKMVGELVQRAFRIGLLRMERNVKDRMSVCDIEEVTAQSLVNARPIVASVREFFASSQLSQFMNQENPLSELTHKRRLSATGPGGLTRERAGFEVRDVHRTHYGRACVIETPEGANVGLILNLTNYSRVNDYGFIETPYRRVITNLPIAEANGEVLREGVTDDKGKSILRKGTKLTKADIAKLKKAKVEAVGIVPRVTTDIVYLDAQDEASTVIASIGNKLDEDGYFLEERVAVRRDGRPTEENVANVTHMDVSPQQTIGAAAGLMPFAEKDNVTRALVGANQQRQAVPLITPQVPIVGTGLEADVARNSGHMIIAEHDGVIRQATASEIVVDYTDKIQKTYQLNTFARSNEGTAMTHRVVVESGQKVKKGDLLADGMSTSEGELALGANLLVGFMPWRGYNFEDAIIISRRLVEDDTLTSVHIEEFSIDVRETKLGPEQVTHDIPNISEEALANLDEEGVVMVGAQVTPGDVLVGKITPKGEQELSSEERLLRAIFGEKAKDVRDSSLRMPNGKHGKVVGIKIFNREDGHELKAGVLRQIHVYVAQMRKVSVGDKLAGRHGNKGVIARIMPVEDMPFMDDGTPLDIVLNPLGVAQRMNIGQIFETHLGWAAAALGYRVASPPFDGVDTETLKAELAKAGLPEDGKAQLYDGRTGEAMKERTTVGYMYINKLKHMIDDKIHARSTGPYTKVTQQPLGGKAQNGGQRFGEMEVWALEAYGVANILQEMLTIKSDDVIGRSKAYESIIKNEDILGPRLPESFNVLVKELQSLGLDVDLAQDDKIIDAEEVLEKEYRTEKSTAPTITDDPAPAVDVDSDADASEYQALDDETDTKAAVATDDSDDEDKQEGKE